MSEEDFITFFIAAAMVGALLCIHHYIGWWSLSLLPALFVLALFALVRYIEFGWRRR